MKDSLSWLGVSSSPVSGIQSKWSIIVGLVFMLFAIGFRKAFINYGKLSHLAALLIFLYGLGEGVASGVFKFDHVAGGLTIMAVIHNIFGGVGDASLLVIPFVIRKLFKREQFPGMHLYSAIAATIGIVFILLFAFRMDYFDHTFLNVYSGIWQRVFLFNYYLYFSVISTMMLKNPVDE